MNIQKFTATTSREALAKARLAFGEGTLILSNRTTGSGIEVVATGEDALAALDRADAARQTSREPSGRTLMAAKKANPNSAVADDATQLAMSTLSFQDYVRERMLRRRQEALVGGAATTNPENSFVAKTPSASQRPAPAQVEQRPSMPLPKVATSPRAIAPTAATQTPGLVDELHAMKAMIEERFNTLTWLGQARQNPIHSNLMLKLIRSGYSPTLARTVLERMPEHLDASQSMRWIMDVLTRNVRTDSGTQAIHEEGGVFALIGSTGVGKTTTAAKLAGLCARAHGANSVGLITLDTYRVGAHEQLRAYGRMLGVVAHLAHDRAALQDLLGLLSGKKMVLIDTTGIAPNDPRKREMLDMLDLAEVQRLLVLNAGSHGDTLDDVVTSFKSAGAQQTILSKTDEAAKIGPALDAVIRHQLVLRGITMGQKVPQDWEQADAAKLVAMSMRSPVKSAYEPKVADLGFFFAEANPLETGKFDA